MGLRPQRDVLAVLVSLKETSAWGRQTSLNSLGTRVLVSGVGH